MNTGIVGRWVYYSQGHCFVFEEGGKRGITVLRVVVCRKVYLVYIGEKVREKLSLECICALL